MKFITLNLDLGSGWTARSAEIYTFSPIVLVRLAKDNKLLQLRLDLGKDRFIDIMPSDLDSDVSQLISREISRKVA